MSAVGDARKRLAERHADDSAAMDIDPNPPGVTQRPFTEAEVAALDGTAASSIDAETVRALLAELPMSDDGTGHVADCGYDPDLMPTCGCYTLPERLGRIVAAALRDEQQARGRAEAVADSMQHFADVAERCEAKSNRYAAENADLRATLAAVRAWAATEHGAKSELWRVLGDETP